MILVFGSLNMDLVMEVEALPRLGETAISEGYVTKPGGKGNNQAVAAARAGAEVMMVGSVGRDDFGDRLIANLQANHINAGAVLRRDEPTGIAAICVDSKGENVITVAAGANRATSVTQVPESALHLGAATVLLQMEIRHEENWALIEHAHKSGALTLLNVAPAAPVPLNALENLDILIVNEHEVQDVARTLGLPVAESRTLARQVAQAARVTCVVTLGAAGALAARGGDLWKVESPRITPVDTTGAGDAFTGVLAAALDIGLPLPDALRRASVGASLACLALGAQESLPTQKAIDDALDRIAPAQYLD